MWQDVGTGAGAAPLPPLLLRLQRRGRQRSQGYAQDMHTFNKSTPMIARVKLSKILFVAFTL